MGGVDFIPAGLITSDLKPADKDYDPTFMDLYGKLLRGEIKGSLVSIPMNAIVPFSEETKPNISDDYKRFFAQELNNGKAKIYLYFKDGKFVMSDDYAAYHMFKELGTDEAMCLVMGDLPDEYLGGVIATVGPKSQ